MEFFQRPDTTEADNVEAEEEVPDDPNAGASDDEARADVKMNADEAGAAGPVAGPASQGQSLIQPSSAGHTAQEDDSAKPSQTAASSSAGPSASSSSSVAAKPKTVGARSSRKPWADMSAESLDADHGDEIAADAQAEEYEERADAASAAGSEETEDFHQASADRQ